MRDFPLFTSQNHSLGVFTNRLFPDTSKFSGSLGPATLRAGEGALDLPFPCSSSDPNHPDRLESHRDRP